MWSEFLIRWAVHTVGVLVATQVIPGLDCASPAGLVVAALLLGILNAFVKPVLTFLSLPLVVLTLGLFLWVINAGLLYFVGWVVKPFHVNSFWSALGGAAVISLISALVSLARGEGRRPIRTSAGSRESRRQGPQGPGEGPVIDV